jgi:DNA polymerase-3 subunit delta
MPGEPLQLLKKDIAENTLRPCYILHGEESYLRSYYTKKLTSCIYPDSETAADLTVLQGKRFQSGDLLNALESVSLFSPRKLIIIRDADISKPDAKVKELFENLYIGEGVTLVFTYEALDFKPDKRTKCFKHINSMALTVEFKQQSEADLIPWLKRRFAAFSKTIETQDARYLLFTCGSLMTNLTHEVTKIACYAGNSAITRADIDAVASPVTETVVFQLTEELSAGRYDKGAAILRHLLEAREEPILLLGLLSRQIRGIYLAKLAITARRDSKFIADCMGYKNDYPARKLMDAARRFSLDWCRKAVQYCAETDRLLKSSGHDKEDALPLLLARLAMS